MTELSYDANSHKLPQGKSLVLKSCEFIRSSWRRTKLHKRNHSTYHSCANSVQILFDLSQIHVQ